MHKSNQISNGTCNMDKSMNDSQQIEYLPDRHPWFQYSMGSYELYFEGHYPMLQVDLRGDVVSRIVQKRDILDYVNLRDNDDRKIVKVAGTLLDARYKMNTDIVVVAAQDGYSLERVKVSPVRIVVSSTHLMYALYNSASLEGIHL